MPGPTAAPMASPATRARLTPMAAWFTAGMSFHVADAVSSRSTSQITPALPCPVPDRAPGRRDMMSVIAVKEQIAAVRTIEGLTDPSTP